jgi:hypothetical protein
VKQLVDPPHRAANSSPIEDVARGPLEPEVREMVEARSAPREDAQLVTARREGASDV